MGAKILITRPKGAAQDFAKDIAVQGFEALHAPMLEIEARDFEAPDLSPYQALIFTSAQGVEMFCASVESTNVPAYAVGQQTEEALRGFEFEEVYSAGGDGDALVEMIANEAPDQARPFLHVRGAHVARPIDELLKAHGFVVENLIVYEAAFTDAFSPDVLAALKAGEVEAVVFFSRRTAENFVKLVGANHALRAPHSIKALCIGPSVLECVQPVQWLEAYVSDQPDRTGMLDLLTRVCDARAGQQPKKDQGTIMQDDNEQEKKSMSAAKKTKAAAIENAAEVIERFGGIRPMAKKINVAVTTVQGWKKRDTIPAGRRQSILDAALAHEVDLSGIMDVAHEMPEDDPANQNQQGTAQNVPDDVDADSEASADVEETADTPTADEPAADSELVVLGELAPNTSVTSTATPDLKAEPRTLDTKLRQTEKSAVAKSTWINFTLLMLGLLAVGAFILFGGEENEASQQRLGALEEDVDQLRGDVSAVKEEQSFLTTLIPADLDARIQRIQDQAVEAQQKVNQAIATAGVISNDVLGEDAGTIEERAAKLQSHVAASPKIQSLLARFQGMSESSLGSSQLDITIVELNDALANAGIGLGGAGQDLTAALDEARQATPSLNETFAEVPAQELKAAAMLLGMTQLRSALNRDNDAFGEDLQLLKNLVGGDAESAEQNRALLEALDKLAPSAEQGILTPSGLVDEFRTMAGDAVVESLKGEDVSLGDKVTSRFGELLQVEKDGELVSGTPTQVTLNQAEGFLEGGDIAGAIAAMENLDGAAGLAAAPWLDQAKATLLADSLKKFLDQGVGSVAEGGELLPRESKFINDEKSGIKILVPGKSLGSSAYR